MKILIHDYAGHPFQLELSEHLSKKGFNVFHLYTKSSSGPKADFSHFNNGLVLSEIKVPDVQKSRFIKRLIHECSYGRHLVKKVKELKPDVVISANTPIPAQIQIQRFCKKNNIKFIFWLQDILSLAAQRVLLRQTNKFIANSIFAVWNYLERSILKNSEAVISITQDFQSVLEKWGVESKRITCIPNWATLEQFPLYSKENEFSKAHSITGTFNVIYSGTLGFKQNPEMIYEAAKLLENQIDIRFIVISEGFGVNKIKELNKKHKLSNLSILPFQPYKLLPQVLSSADVLLTLLEKEAGVFCVPSKVLTGFCTGRASILMVPSNNLAARITQSNNAGIVVKHDAVELVNAILDLKNNAEKKIQMGKNARAYAEKYFNIDKVSEQFLGVINGSK